MKLGLLGFPINHSLSPKIYGKLLGSDLKSYELFSYAKPEQIPSLKFFAEHLDGLNITSPYKTHFLKEITIESELVKKLEAVNTLAFTNSGVLGTNTDLLAVEKILLNHLKTFSSLEIFLLGDGVMASLTKLVASSLKIPLKQFSRKLTPGFSQFDLSKFESDSQKIIINSCSREFEFKGKVSGNEIFWDYNYSLIAHQKSLPLKVLAYHDGQEMLELQALEAVKFWKKVIPKLN